MVEARTIFCDFDDLFEKYMKEVGFDVAARMAGVVMKRKNTIVGEWPLRGGSLRLAVVVAGG